MDFWRRLRNAEDGSAASTSDEDDYYDKEEASPLLRPEAGAVSEATRPQSAPPLSWRGLPKAGQEDWPGLTPQRRAMTPINAREYGLPPEFNPKKPPLQEVVKEAKNAVTSTQLRPMLLVTIVATLHSVSSEIYTPTITQYLYARLARKYTFNSTTTPQPGISPFCSPNVTKEDNDNDIAVQKEQTELKMEYELIVSVLSAAMTLLVGAYADAMGRRTILIFTSVTRLAKYAIFVAIVRFELDVHFLFLAYFIDGISGSTFSLNVGLFSYIADISPAAKGRTLALAVLNSIQLFCSSSMALGSGYVIEFLGFTWGASLAGGLIFVCLLFTIFVLPESRPNTEFKCISPLTGLKSVAKFYVVKEKGRSRAVLLLGSIAFWFIVLASQFSAGTLYEMGHPFCWTAVKIGWVTFIGETVTRLMGLAYLKVMHLCVDDDVLVVIGIFTSVAALVEKALAYNDLMLYLVILIGAPGGNNMVIIRSLLSSMASPNDQGVLFASVSAVEALIFILGIVLSAEVYQSTISIMRGFVYLLSSSILFIAGLFVVAFVCLARRRRKEDVAMEISIQATQANVEPVVTSATVAKEPEANTQL